MYTWRKFENSLDENASKVDCDSSSEKNICHGFIKKVISILMFELSVTLGIFLLLSFSERAKTFLKHHKQDGIVYVISAIALQLIAYLILACGSFFQRKTTLFFISLFIFSCIEGTLLGILSVITVTTNEILVALGITGVICLALSAFAFQTKWDFTEIRAAVFTIFIALILFISFGIFMQCRMILVIFGVFGIMLITYSFLTCDAHIIISALHGDTFSKEESIAHARDFYLDIAGIFWFTLLITISEKIIR